MMAPDTCRGTCHLKDYRDHRIATLFGQVTVRLPRYRCAECRAGEAGVGWPSNCRSTPELDQLQAHLIVQMPDLQTFRDAESYYAVLAHETTHATRHESRLDRDLGRKRFGDAGYAMEELCAEIGAAFLCADLGITPETRDDHAAYISSWLKVLKDDKRAIFTAASHAQKAADFLHGLQPHADTAPAEELQEAA